MNNPPRLYMFRGGLICPECAAEVCSLYQGARNDYEPHEIVDAFRVLHNLPADYSITDTETVPYPLTEAEADAQEASEICDRCRVNLFEVTHVWRVEQSDGWHEDYETVQQALEEVNDVVLDWALRNRDSEGDLSEVDEALAEFWASGPDRDAVDAQIVAGINAAADYHGVDVRISQVTVRI